MFPLEGVLRSAPSGKVSFVTAHGHPNDIVLDGWSARAPAFVGERVSVEVTNAMAPARHHNQNWDSSPPSAMSVARPTAMTRSITAAVGPALPRGAPVAARPLVRASSLKEGGGGGEPPEARVLAGRQEDWLQEAYLSGAVSDAIALRLQRLLNRRRLVGVGLAEGVAALDGLAPLLETHPVRFFLLLAVGTVFANGTLTADLYAEVVGVVRSGAVDDAAEAYLAPGGGDTFGDVSGVSPPLPAWGELSAFDSTEDDRACSTLLRGLLLGVFVPVLPPLHHQRKLVARVVGVAAADVDARANRRYVGEVVPGSALSQQDFRWALKERTYKNCLFLQRSSRNLVPIALRVGEEDEAALAARRGHIVAVRFVEWPSRKGKMGLFPIGVIDWEVDLGPAGSLDARVGAVLVETGLHDRVAFPPEVEAEVAAATEAFDDVLASEARVRVDHRDDLNVFTIDPPGSTDLDDACSVTRLDDGSVEIGVHIADPTFFVRPGTALDAEARRRACTVYLVGGSLPMIPRSLSGGLCSLLPGVPRLAVSVFWRVRVDALTGRVQDVPLLPGPDVTLGGRLRVERTVIRNAARLTYSQAQSVINGTVPMGLSAAVQAPYTVPALQIDLLTLHHLTMGMRLNRLSPAVDDGTGSFEQPGGRTQMRFHQVARGRPVDIILTPEPTRGDQDVASFVADVEGDGQASHRLIEELALAANNRIAEHMSRVALPEARDLLVLRTQPAPPPAQLANLRVLCNSRGIKLDTSSIPALQASLAALHESQRLSLSAVLYNMGSRKATYSCCGTLRDAAPGDALTDARYRHHSLNMVYTHFTSPIRRYPDMLVHRTLAYTMDRVGMFAASPSDAAAADLDALTAYVGEDVAVGGPEVLQGVCDAVTGTSRVVASASNRVFNLHLTQLFYGHIGDATLWCRAVVVGLGPGFLRVRLPDLNHVERLTPHALGRGTAIRYDSRIDAVFVEWDKAGARTGPHQLADWVWMGVAVNLSRPTADGTRHPTGLRFSLDAQGARGVEPNTPMKLLPGMGRTGLFRELAAAQAVFAVEGDDAAAGAGAASA